ncbi:MAG: hypothetical protein H6604_04085 [Flavobacteriales bacterium]|nr:hypothetical protein [Flavobacteriales bacterium]
MKNKDDFDEVSIIKEVSIDIAKQIERENKAFGLTSMFTKNNKTYLKKSDGSISEIKKASNQPLKSSLKLKKGTVLYAK